ncbi:hypothetical protein CRG98_014089 [Punica granatum]|uniref:Uncharacterized protein n=1 Tax=Punica granatum TaxID=22663 RepID=A0A2I0KAM2_PUNGR|nr:hypothetical protein CRG98_014089 [Punica granatum]
MQDQQEPWRPRIGASESGIPIRITKAKTLHGSPKRPEIEEHASQTLPFTCAYKSLTLISDPSGYVGAPPQSSSPTSQDWAIPNKQVVLSIRRKPSRDAPRYQTTDDVQRRTNNRRSSSATMHKVYPGSSAFGSIPATFSAKLTNDTSESISGAYRLSRNTPDLSRTPFLTGLPGSDPLTRFLEGRFSGSDRLPVNLQGTFTENRDHSDPRTPQDIRGTLRKPRSQVPRNIDISNPHETTSGMILTQLGVQCHRPCIKRPPGASCRVVSSSGASGENLRMLSFRNHRRHDPQWKIYMCSPLETTAGVILSPLGIQRNQPRTKRPPRSTGTAPTSRTASRVYQSTRPHRFVSVHSRGQNRLPKPLFPGFLDFSCIPGLGIIIPDSEKLGLLRFLCICGEIRSLNRSRGDLVGSSKPKEPLGLTPREVAESPSWLPRATDGLLSPTQVVSRVFTFFASHESTPFY